eukprot:7409545-Karenia_brevis.AAC.1
MEFVPEKLEAQTTETGQKHQENRARPTGIATGSEVLERWHRGGDARAQRSWERLCNFIS